MWLAIESSCDESALALFDPAHGLVGEWVYSQMALHAGYGGVVPDLASREHVEHFPPLLREVLATLGDRRPTAIAVTVGPGLAGCLAVGVALAKSLGFAWGVPVVGLNHLRGHAFSVFVPRHAEHPAGFAEAFRGLLPHLGLLVSGGNTLLFALDEQGHLTELGRTVDDAAGEALDKGAKLLGLGYPGGPLVEKLAATGNPAAYDFPRPFADDPTLRFSFAGLKTSLRYRLEKLSDAELAAALPDLCASYQEAVVEALASKVRRALRHHGPWRSVGLSGGVANNRRLRARLATEADRAGVPLLAALPKHTGDNAAMIAFAAWLDRDGPWPMGHHFALGIRPDLRLTDTPATPAP